MTRQKRPQKIRHRQIAQEKTAGGVSQPAVIPNYLNVPNV
jgi:hypothetical protein